MDPEDDPIVGVLPIHYSNNLFPTVQIHQFPLLTRPLQAPPSAILAGKRIRARIKPNVKRLEVHVPADVRPEVWNTDKAKELGAAQIEDDKEKNQERPKSQKQRETEEPRLSEARMKSEEIPQKGVHMLGIVRDGKLHLHPISQTHQMRPTLTYLDILSRKNKKRGDDSDSDDGPPLDPDDPVLPAPVAKKDKKVVGEAKEVQVTARKAADTNAIQPQGGMTAVRREMLHAMRVEEDEEWQDIEFCDGETQESGDAFDAVFSQRDETLECKTQMTAYLKNIEGLL